MKRILLVGLMLMVAVPAMAKVGTFFYPQVPNPAAMTIDGNDDDWGWYPESLAYTIESTWQRYGTWYGKDDYDFVMLNAWSAAPDNKLYTFCRVIDDTLSLVNPPMRWWADDCIQMNIDADYAGGNHLGSDLSQVANGQRQIIRILPPADEPLLPNQTAIFFSQLEFIDAPELLWGVAPEFFDVAWTVLPAGAGNLSTNVTYTYEWAGALWDIWGLSEAESVRHNFALDDVIGLGYRIDDVDGFDDAGGSRCWYFPVDATGVAADAGFDTNSDVLPAFYAIEGPTTAVESESWGRIKSQMQ
jgi:hypothetical protein